MLVVEQSDDTEGANCFIYEIRIEKFFNEQSRAKFQAKVSEGILLADSGENEYQTDVYFWSNRRYQHEPVDY